MTYSNADFTPGMKGYSDIKPFRFWCQKVLPLVYDDSLSYYELLCKVTDYINNIITDLATTEENVGSLLDAYNQLQDYVNNYFTNLDVQEEINNHLDDLVEDGTLTRLIGNYVQPYLDDFKEQMDTYEENLTEDIGNYKTQMNQNFSELQSTTENDLQQQNGKIFVLEGRMDTFTNLPTGSTSGDAELQDIRVAYDGSVYATAGDAVRGQSSELSTAISKFNCIAKQFRVSGNHSSSIDQIYFSIPQNDSYRIQLVSSTGEALSITPLAYDANDNSINITPVDSLGTVYEKTASADIVKFGFWIDAPAQPCTVTVFIANINSPVYANEWNNMQNILNSNIMNIFSAKTLTFHLIGNHSTNVDRISYNIPVNTKYKISMVSSTGEALSITLVAYGANGESANVGAIDSLGNVYEKVAGFDITEFGYYIPAPSKPCDVNVMVVGENTGVFAEPKIEELSKLLGASFTKWHVNAGQTHSSTLDKVNVNIKNGDTVKALLLTSDGSINTGVVANLGPITTGEIFEYTASADMTSVGVYMEASPSACDVYFYILQENYLSGESTEIPKMWKTNIDTVLNEVALLQTYESGCTFGFISDIHWEANWQKSPQLIKYICENSPVKMWINGGDTATGDGGNGNQQLQWLFEAIGRFENSCERFYSVIGNHDNNHNDGIGTTLSDATLHNIIMPKYNDVIFGNKTYYYFEHDDTRYVCLDNGVNYASDPTQIAWAKSVIESTNKPVVIVMHIVYVNPTDTEPCGFYNELIQAVGSDQNVKFIIAGHLHDDRHFIGDTGIPVLLLNTDSKLGNDGTVRDLNTTREQCMSIITADYDNKKITVSRIGTVKTSFVVNY